MAAPPPRAAGGAPAYFVDSKKGEIPELKALMRGFSAERDPKRKRDVIKKVIAYMTLGIDVSRLFSEMILAVETRDIVVKKMVFLYLCTYAQSNPELAIMSVNSMLNDATRNEDPMVRGLALRSICSLKLESLVEYITEPLQQALNDNSSYVRKTAVLGVLKLFHLAPQVIHDNNMVDKIYDMLLDQDAQVVTNCILVLEELMADEGGMAVNQRIIQHLLNRIRDFNEWGQTTVLQLLARYTPSSQEETFAIMNILEECMRVSNSAVVLAAAKCFLLFTENIPELQGQVYERLKTPLLTLMSGSSPELEWCVLQHIHLLVQRAPGVFDSEFRQFFVRYNEPMTNKHLKVDILPLIASQHNLNDMLAELSEYVADVDAEMARRAIRAIGVIASRVAAGADAIIDQLIAFLDMDVDYVRCETVVVLKNLLRKYPDRKSSVLPSLPRCLRVVDDAQGRAAVLYMIGEFGEDVVEAPYIIEPLIDSFEEISDVEIRLELLTTTMKLFFKRPPEVHLMLGRLLQAAIEDVTSPDLHDRALLYYRLLETDITAAQDVIATVRGAVAAFAEEEDSGLRQRLFREFNTLAVVYGKPAEQFIAPEHLIPDPEPGPSPLGDASAPGLGPATGGGGAAAAAAPAAAPAPAPAPADSVDLLGGWDAPAPAPAAAAGGAFALDASPQLDSTAFQAQWGQLADVAPERIPLSGGVPAQAAVEAAFAARNVLTMASGDVGGFIKLYLYGQSGASLFLTECVVDKAAGAVNVTAKTADGARREAFMGVVRSVLGSL